MDAWYLVRSVTSANEKHHWASVCRDEPAINELYDKNNCTEEVYFGEKVQIDNIDTGSWYSILNVSTR